MREFVTITETAPRDGLQNEQRLVPLADKIALVDALSACGFAQVEATSFVSPARVPQLADAAALMAGIARRPGTAIMVLTPNMRGFEAASAAKADRIAVFASASEAFSQANLGCSIADSLERFRPVLEAARANGLPVRGYVSAVIACPYSGPVEPGAVADLAARLAALGCADISLGDTIGAGTPQTVAAMLKAVLAVLPAPRLAGHFHDTGGTALANVETALDLGLRSFDAAAGGLGGCPFAPGAPGNLATEALIARLDALGFDTGIDPDRLAEAAAFAQSLRSPAP